MVPASWVQSPIRARHVQVAILALVDRELQRPSLVMVSRDIRKHPNVEDALLINALISNRGEHSQPWPMLELRLSNLDERPMAMRRFLPRDYLSDPDRISGGMPAVKCRSEAPCLTLNPSRVVMSIKHASSCENFIFQALAASRRG